MYYGLCEYLENEFMRKRDRLFLFLRYEQLMDLDVLWMVQLVHATHRQQIELFVIDLFDEIDRKETW